MRKEIKFYIPRQKALILYQLLKPFCKRDPYGDYQVQSLYFDTFDQRALNEKVNGVDRIGKIRIRKYNDEKVYKLEHKYKKGDFVIKSSHRIEHETYLRILSNPNYIRTFFPRFIELKPRQMVSYHRKVLVYKDIRFTFDDHLRVSTTKPSLHCPCINKPIIDDLIFEVKYTYGIPVHLKKILMDCGIEMSLSKYAVANMGV